jgi:hypothetical protein
MNPFAIGYLVAFASGSLLTAYCLAMRRPAKKEKPELNHFLRR